MIETGAGREVKNALSVVGAEVVDLRAAAAAGGLLLQLGS